MYRGKWAGTGRSFIFSKCASINFTYNLIELRLREHTASHASYNRYAQLKKKIKFNKKEHIMKIK